MSKPEPIVAPPAPIASPEPPVEPAVPPPKSNDFSGQRVPLEERSEAQPFAHPVPDDFPFDTLPRPLKSKEVDHWKSFANAFIQCLNDPKLDDDIRVERAQAYADKMIAGLRRRRYIHDKD